MSEWMTWLDVPSSLLLEDLSDGEARTTEQLRERIGNHPHLDAFARRNLDQVLDWMAAPAQRLVARDLGPNFSVHYQITDLGRRFLEVHPLEKMLAGN